MIVEASVDLGASWSRSVVAVPGEEISVRVRVLYMGLGSPMGFGGMTHVPTLRAWDSSRDVALPAIPSLPPDAPANAYGRPYPFNSVGNATAPPFALIPNYVTEDVELRWATVRTLPPGTLTLGLNSAQAPRSLNATGYSESLDVVVFRYGFVAGPGAARTMVADVPLALINNARTTWFTTDAGTSPLQIALDAQDISPAEIRIVPAPGAWCVVASVFAGVGTRRRSRSEACGPKSRELMP